MRSAETELQNTIELRATASEIVAPKPDLDAILKQKGFLEGKSASEIVAPKPDDLDARAAKKLIFEAFFIF